MAKDAGAEYFRLTADGFEIRFPSAAPEAPKPQVTFVGPLPLRGKVVERSEGGELVAVAGEDGRPGYSHLFKGKAPRLGDAPHAPPAEKAE